MNVSAEITLNASAWRMKGMVRRILKNSMADSLGLANGPQAAAFLCQSVLPIESLATFFLPP
jgi:hypothetical protein